MVLTLLVIAGALNLSFLHNRLDMVSDQKVYMLAAQSLAAGDGYAIAGEAQTTWPPGYSLVIAPAQALAPQAVWLLKLLNVAFATGALLCFYAALRRFRKPLDVFLVVLLAGVSLPWFKYTHMVMSEALFALGIGLFAWFSVKYLEKPSRTLLAALVIVAGLLPLVRLIGLAAWFGLLWLLWLDDGRGWRALRERRWPRVVSLAVLSAIALLPLAWWFSRNIQLTGSVTGYVAAMGGDEFTSNAIKLGIADAGLLSRLVVNTIGYTYALVVPNLSLAERIPQLPLPVHPICWLLALLMLVGWARSLAHRQARPIGLFYAAYGGMLLTNVWYDIRYLMPVLPLYSLYLVIGGESMLQGISAWVKARRGRPSPPWLQVTVLVRGGLLLLIVAFLILSQISGPAKRLRSATYSGLALAYYQAGQHLRDHGGNGRVLVVTPGLLDMWSGRDFVSITSLKRNYDSDWPAHIPPDVDTYVWGEHVVATDYRSVLMAAQPESWQEVKHFGDGAVILYARKPAQPLETNEAAD